MREESLMGRAYTLTIPASGVGVDPVPISVSGETFFSCIANLEIAYDPADFASDQFATFVFASNVPTMRFAPKTILWVRQDPTIPGSPATALSVLTQIGQGDY